MAVLVADLVKKLHSNIDSIHQTIQSLSDTTSHDAELDRLSHERDIKVQGLRKGHEDAVKALRAQREKEAQEMMEKRRKEEEELEAERRREYEEMMARRSREDADRKRRIEEQEREWERIKAEEDRERERQRDLQEKSLQDTIEAELEKLEDEMERKVEEGKKALQELDENRRAINAQIEEALYAPSVIPKIHFRSRAKTIGQPAIDDGQKGLGIPKEHKLMESHAEKAIDQPTTTATKLDENVKNQSTSQVMMNGLEIVSIEEDKTRSLNVDSAVGQPAQMSGEKSNNPLDNAEGNSKHENGNFNVEDSTQVESEMFKNLDTKQPNETFQQKETSSNVESPIGQSARTDGGNFGISIAEYPDSISQQDSSRNSNSSPIQSLEHNSPNEKIETPASPTSENQSIKDISSIEIENPTAILQEIPAVEHHDDSGPRTEQESIHETTKTPLNETTNSIVAPSPQDQEADLSAQAALDDSTLHEEQPAQEILPPISENSVEFLTPGNKSETSEEGAITANLTKLSPEASQSVQTSHDSQPTAEPSDEGANPEDVPLPAATPNTEQNLQFNSAIAPADPSQRLEQDFLIQDEESLEKLEEKVGNFQEGYAEHGSTDPSVDSSINKMALEESSNENSAILSQTHSKSVLHNEKGEILEESSEHENSPQTPIFDPKTVNHIASPNLSSNENHDGSLSFEVNSGTAVPPLPANFDLSDDEGTQNSLEKTKLERLELLNFPRLRNRGAFNRDLAAIHGFNSSGSSDGSRSPLLNQNLALVPQQTNTVDVVNAEVLEDGRENDFAAREDQVKRDEIKENGSLAEHKIDRISSTTSQISSDDRKPINLDAPGNNTPRDIIPLQDDVHFNQDIQNVDPNYENKELDSNSSSLKHQSDSQAQNNYLDYVPSANEQDSHASEPTRNTIPQELVGNQGVDSKDVIPSDPIQPDTITHAKAPASPIAPARKTLTSIFDNSEQTATGENFDSRDDSPSQEMGMKSGRATPEKPILKSESSPNKGASTPPKKVQFQDFDSLNTNTKSIHLPPDFDITDNQEQQSQHERDQSEDAPVPQSNMDNSDAYKYEDYSPTPTGEVFTRNNEEVQPQTPRQDSREHSAEAIGLHTAESPVTGADANDLFDDDEDDVPHTPTQEIPQQNHSITSPIQSSPIQSRWAQLRKNAAERAAATRNIEQTSTNEPERTTPVGHHFLETVTQEPIRSPNSSKSETTSGGDETDDFQSVSEFPSHSRTQSDETTQSIQSHGQLESAAQRSRSATTDSLPSYAHSDGNSTPSSPSEAPSSPFQEIPGDEPAISSSWQSPGRVVDPRESSPALKSEALPLSRDFDPYNPQSYPSYISPTVSGASINDSKRAHRADLTPLVTQNSPQPKQEDESPILPANERPRSVSQTSTASPTRIPRRSLNSNRTSSPINPATTSFFQKTRQLFEAPITTAHQASHARTSSPRPLSGLFYSSSASPSPNSKTPTSFHSTKPPVSPYDETKDGEEPEIIPRSLDRDGRAPSPVYSLPTPPPPPPKDPRANTQSTQGSFFGGLGKWVGTGGLEESIYNPNRRTPEGQPLMRSGLTGGPRRGRSQSGYDGEGYGN